MFSPNQLLVGIDHNTYNCRSNRGKPHFTTVQNHICMKPLINLEQNKSNLSVWIWSCNHCFHILIGILFILFGEISPRLNLLWERYFVVTIFCKVEQGFILNGVVICMNNFKRMSINMSETVYLEDFRYNISVWL